LTWIPLFLLFTFLTHISWWKRRNANGLLPEALKDE
jgi:hypothetical protein